jgi:signal transduction histidine kinase
MDSDKPFNDQSPFKKAEFGRSKRLMIGICNALLIIVPILLAGLTIMLVNNLTNQTVLVYSLVACMFPISLCARFLAKRGRVIASGYTLILPILIIIAINGSIIVGLSPIIGVSYSLAIIVAGMVIGPRQGYFIAGLCVLLFVLARLVVISGVIPVLTITDVIAEVVVIIVYGLALAFVAVLSKLTTQDLRKSLDEATYDLLEANHKLALASEMKSQFTARTSHELRTPLSSIIVFTELAIRGTYGEITPKLKGKLGNVLGSARHLHNIINDLLDLAKIEAGELEIEEEPFSIYDLGMSVQSTMEETANQKDLEFDVEMDESLPARIIGDEGRVKQILLNLTGNAIKFTDCGRVTVRIDPLDMDRWRIAVSDTGPGIPEDRFETIFEEYRQLETASKDADRKGTGLGLAITRNLVELMGGEMSLESELGEGTTFEIILPLKTPEAVPATG